MSELLTRLRENRTKVWETAKTIADKAAEANRVFDAEEQRQWDAANHDLDFYDARIKEVLDGENRMKATEEQFAALRGGRRGTPPPTRDADLVEQFRAAVRDRSPKPILYEGEARTWIPGGRVEKRTLLTSEDSGNLVPEDFLTRLLAAAVDTSGVLAAGATVINSPNGRDLRIPRVTTHATAGWITEASAIAYDEPSAESIVLGSKKLAWRTSVSHEMLQDSGLNISGWLARENGITMGNQLGPALATGASGGNNPTGITIGVIQAVTGTVTGTSGLPTAEDIVRLISKVPTQWKTSANCAFIMHPDTLLGIRLLRESGTTGGWMFEDLIGGRGRSAGNLFGYPVFEDAWMPAGAGGKSSIVFGSISDAFWVRYVEGLRWESDNGLGPGFTDDTVHFRGITRVDSGLVLPDAVRAYRSAAT